METSPKLLVVCPAVGNHTFTTFKSDAQAPWL
jgi:hypothetical protein